MLNFALKNSTQKEILDFSLWHIFLKISPSVIDLNDTIETFGTGALRAVRDSVVDVVLKRLWALLGWENFLHVGCPGIQGTEMNLPVHVSVFITVTWREE